MASFETRPRADTEVQVPADFLARPAVLKLWGEPAEPETSPEPPPDSTPEDRYVFGGEVGRGGMARVYRAQDRQLDRPVAIKLFDADPELETGLRREAQAQARVRHENVLEVYETGELGGRPFLAMRFVDGVPLDELPPETPLDEKVRLLVRVARALHAAHRQGLVHRDVKPSNILVEQTSEGLLKPWVTDFGISAELRRGEADAEGSVLGTPCYMAPEQARGQPVDRRTDVYGLGVTLYEIFTGELPFPPSPIPSLVLQRIVREDPPPPRRFAPALPAELEAVILRCLAKDPADRYPSARAVADDLQRYLDGDVVEAHAAGWSYRLSKFVLRHRTLLAVTAAAALLLLTTATVLGLREMRANARAEMRQAQAEDLLGFLLVDLRERLEPLGHLDLLDDVWREAESYFRRVPPEELSDDELSRRSRALYQLGDLRIRRGDLTGALDPLRQSLTLAEALHRRNPDDPRRLFELGQSHFWLGYVHERRGDLERAEPRFQSYLEISRRLVALDPSHDPWRLELAYAYGNLATIRERQERLEESRELLEKSLEIKAARAAEDRSDATRRQDLAVTHNKLGVVLQRLGRSDAARRHFETDLELRRELARSRPEHTGWRDDLAVSHNYLGGLLRAQERLEPAIRHYEAAVEIYEALVRHEPEHAVWRHKLALNLGALGLGVFEAGDRERGLALLERRHELTREVSRLDPTFLAGRLELAASHRHLGRILDEMGRPSRAREHVEQARAAYEGLLAQGHHSSDVRQGAAEATLLWGTHLARDGRAEAARVAWRRAVELTTLGDRETSSGLRELRRRALRKLEESPPSRSRVKPD